MQGASGPHDTHTPPGVHRTPPLLHTAISTFGGQESPGKVPTTHRAQMGHCRPVRGPHKTRAHRGSDAGPQPLGIASHAHGDGCTRRTRRHRSTGRLAQQVQGLTQDPDGVCQVCVCMRGDSLRTQTHPAGESPRAWAGGANFRNTVMGTHRDSCRTQMAKTTWGGGLKGTCHTCKDSLRTGQPDLPPRLPFAQKWFQCPILLPNTRHTHTPTKTWTYTYPRTIRRVCTQRRSHPLRPRAYTYTNCQNLTH